MFPQTNILKMCMILGEKGWNIGVHNEEDLGNPTSPPISFLASWLQTASKDGQKSKPESLSSVRYHLLHFVTSIGS